MYSRPEFKEGTQRQAVKAEAAEKGYVCLALHGLLILISYMIQDHLPRMISPIVSLALSHQYQEKCLPQTNTLDNLMEARNPMVSLPRQLYFLCKTAKINHHNYPSQ